MPTIRYRDLVDYEITDEPGKELFFAFGVRKCGSSIFNNIVHAVATMNGVNFVDIAGRMFEKGLRAPQWQFDPGLSVLLRPGNVYGGFRNFPAGIRDDKNFLAGKKLLMIRDPRDALVSEYYSNAYSHSLPVQGQARDDMLKHREQARASEIDAYVLRMATPLRRTLGEYESVLEDPNLRIIRYEDVILEKELLLRRITEYFSWTISEQQVKQILGWADVIPDEERPREFIRRVVPGDHRQKLSSATIAQLNETFSKELKYYGYA